MGDALGDDEFSFGVCGDFDMPDRFLENRERGQGPGSSNEKKSKKRAPPLVHREKYGVEMNLRNFLKEE